MDPNVRPDPPLVILRHRKERLSKCSIEPIRHRPDVALYPFPAQHAVGQPLAGVPDAALRGRVLLKLGAPELSPADAAHGLLLIDGTWRYTAKMLRAVEAWPGLDLRPRRLPETWKTAYPRRQTEAVACPEPAAGLASIEAVFAAFAVLGWDCAGLLEAYPWRDEFLRLNLGHV